MMQAFLLIVAGLFGGVLYREYVLWRVRRCDACRVEAMGSRAIHVPHTCSRRNAIHKDSKGNVREFGRKVRSR